MIMPVARGCLYDGIVVHRRLMPVQHSFRYRVFSMLLDIDQLEAIDEGLNLFSIERFNLFSFMNKDHGRRDGSALRPWIESQLNDRGLARPHKILVHCFPRLLGYVFNPLSVYYCYDDQDQCFAVVYEVKNTFGDQHCYVAKIDNPDIFQHGSDKTFFVSPFIDISGHYRFGGHQPGVRYHLKITKYDKLGRELEASQTGSRATLSDGALIKRFFTYPLMTFKVIAGIHVEALRLWLKGAPRFTHPGSSSVA